MDALPRCWSSYVPASPLCIYNNNFRFRYIILTETQRAIGICFRKEQPQPLAFHLLLWWSWKAVIELSCNDRSWWRHPMEPFSALLAFCAGNSSVPVNTPHKSQLRRALMFSLIYAWINDWVNNREDGDLRHHCGHYDVIVMFLLNQKCWYYEIVSWL